MIKLLKTGSFFVNILILFSFFLLSFGQIGRIQIGVWPVYLYLFEPLVGISLLFLIAHFGKKHFLKQLPWAVPIGVFIIWMLLSLLISSFRYELFQNMVALLYLLRLVLYLFFPVYLYRYLKMYPSLVIFIQFGVGLFAVLTVLFSVVQYLLYQNLGNLAYLGWDPHLGRMVGLFFDPPLTIAVFVLLGIFFFLNFKIHFLKWGIAGVFIILSFLTFSRGGYLALFITVAFYAVRKVKIVYIFFGAAIITALFFFLPSDLNESLNLRRTTSIFTRFNDYEKGIRIWREHPIEGIGYNHIRYEKDKYSEELITEIYNPSHAAASFHSSFLMILVTGGVVGLSLYIWMLVSIGRINEMARYGMIFLSMLSLTDNVLLHPFILLHLAVLIGASTHLSDTSRSK
jgi:O-antigen ligase